MAPDETLRNHLADIRRITDAACVRARPADKALAQMNLDFVDLELRRLIDAVARCGRAE